MNVFLVLDKTKQCAHFQHRLPAAKAKDEINVPIALSACLQQNDERTVYICDAA